ncbi:hypothetical protein [Nibricoccus sp. IMCC34717]|uniref:hypothetical protein n=1 Tax=Nibricoccus sp. IMCC34717 TaxID=3034021 RepID=UPI00385075B2
MPNIVSTLSPDLVSLATQPKPALPAGLREAADTARKDFRNLLGRVQGGEERKGAAAESPRDGMGPLQKDAAISAKKEDGTEELTSNPETSADEETLARVAPETEGKREMPPGLAAVFPFLPPQAQEALRKLGFAIPDVSATATEGVSTESVEGETAIAGLNTPKGAGTNPLLFTPRRPLTAAPAAVGAPTSVENAPSFNAPAAPLSLTPTSTSTSTSTSPSTSTSTPAIPLPVPQDFLAKLKEAGVPAEVITKISDMLGIEQTQAGLVWKKGRGEALSAKLLPTTAPSAVVSVSPQEIRSASPAQTLKQATAQAEPAAQSTDSIPAAGTSKIPQEIQAKIDAAKIAGPRSPRGVSGVETLGNTKFDSELAIDNEVFKLKLMEVGTDAAIRGESPMSSRHTPTFDPALRAADAPVASREVATSAPSHAASAVDAVREIREVGASLSTTRRNVELAFDFGPGEKLSVKLEVRAGEVHATFRTTSTDLRDALSQAWQGESNRDSKQKFADPVFVSAENRDAARQFSQGDSRHQQRQAGDEASRTPQSFSSVLLSSSRPAPVATAAPLSHAVVASDRKLQAFV